MYRWYQNIVTHNDIHIYTYIDTYIGLYRYIDYQEVLILRHIIVIYFMCIQISRYVGEMPVTKNRRSPASGPQLS